MKKLLAILLVLAMILSLAACDGEKKDQDKNDGDKGDVLDNDQDDEDDKESDDRGVSDSSDSRFAKTINMVSENDVFAVEIGDDSYKIAFYRDNDNISMSMDFFGTENRAMVLGKTLYSFDAEEMTYFVVELDDEQYADYLDNYNFGGGFAEAYDFSMVTLVDTGEDEFDGEKREYEDFEGESGSITRIYFDGKDVVGLVDNGEPTPFSISFTVPDDAFDIPEDYEEVEADEDFDINEVFAMFMF